MDELVSALRESGALHFAPKGAQPLSGRALCLRERAVPERGGDRCRPTSGAAARQRQGLPAYRVPNRRWTRVHVRESITKSTKHLSKASNSGMLRLELSETGLTARGIVGCAGHPLVKCTPGD
jgi:hypothetical protein